MNRRTKSLRPDFIEMAHHARQVICRERLAEVPGARRAVEALRLPKAVASSSRPDFLREKLALGGLLDLFDPHVYSTALVERAKPHPDIFLYAAEQLATAPKRCLVIEDSSNGVKSGLAAGMTVWGFVGGGHCDAVVAERLLSEGAERIIETWDEARALFERA
jgi:HAD superfamily hydrolase (TIGR01509 family)